jgi:hypothetical protein
LRDYLGIASAGNRLQKFHFRRMTAAPTIPPTRIPPSLLAVRQQRLNRRVVDRVVQLRGQDLATVVCPATIANVRIADVENLIVGRQRHPPFPSPEMLKRWL